jgi:hypothetical protein
MQVLGPAGVVPSKEDLLKQYKQDLDKVIEQINVDVEPERVFQLRRAQEADLVWRQLQNSLPQFTDSTISAYSATGSPILGGSRDDSDDYVQNIYRGYGRKLIAVIGQRLPNIKASPDDPDDNDSLKSSSLADTAAAVLRAAWNVEIKCLEVIFFLWKSSTVFFYTPWVTDGFKYGYTTEPNIEPEDVPTAPAPGAPADDFMNQGTTETPQPPSMQLPKVGEPQQYANGAVELELCNSLFVTVPFRSKTMDDAAWLRYEYEEYQSKLKEMYPELRANPPQDNSSGSDSSSSHLGTQIRDAAASPRGIPSQSANRWTYTRIWIQPHLLEMIEDTGTVQILKKNFPDGMKLTIVQGQTIKIENERMTDVWCACKPETSEFLIPDALGADMLPIQRLKNDMMNIARLTLESGAGLNFFNAGAINPNFFTKQRPVPNRMFPILPGVGQTMESMFHQIQSTTFSDQLVPWEQHVESDGQSVVGITPPIYGASAYDGETAHQAELEKNGALQQLMTLWIYVRQAWAQVYTNGVKQLSRYGAGMLKSVKQGQQGYEALMVDIAELKESGWHFESDPAFPMTISEQRGTLMWLLSLGPDVQNGLQLFHPENVDQINKLLGWTGLFNPARDQKAKAQAVIHDLIQPGAKATQQPQPDGSMKPVPSIPPDQFEDNHQFMAEEMRSWCVSSIGRRVRDANPDGYQNVVARGMAELALTQPPPPAPEAPTPRLSFSGKDLPVIAQMFPEEFKKLMTDFRLEPGTPPIQPKEGSAPGPLGTAGAAGPPGGAPNVPGMPLPGAGAAVTPSPASVM